MFACDKFGYVPDMITCAKGMTSGYSPIGACIVSDRLAEPFYKGDNTFLHGYTFGGHPVSAAVGLANLDIFEREGLNQHVLDNEGAFLADPGEAARPADRRRRPRQRLLLRHRAGQGQGHQGDLHRRGDRARPVRLPLQGAVRQRPVLPGRRPRRPGRPARPAADLRPGDLRRDRADPARGAHGGVDEALDPAVHGCAAPAAFHTVHTAPDARRPSEKGRTRAACCPAPRSDSLACPVTDRPCLRSPGRGIAREI